jgi:hypothetical protein
LAPTITLLDGNGVGFDLINGPPGLGTELAAALGWAAHASGAVARTPTRVARAILKVRI